MVEKYRYCECDSCPRINDKVVPGYGPRGAKIIYVAEAPGSVEVAKGRPLCGPSGELLRRATEAAGFSYKDCYRTNVILCRPPNNRTPDLDEIACCGYRLWRELIAISTPDTLIVTLGNVSSQYLFNDEDLKITKIRGRLRSLTLGDKSLRVLPTLHPAAVLRNPSDLPLFLNDIRTAARLATNPNTIATLEPKYKVVRPLGMEPLVDKLLRQEYLAADIETTELDPWTGRLLCLGVAWRPEEVFIIPEDTFTAARKQVRRLLESPGPRWIWHNGKFDTTYLWHLGFAARVDEDCMLLHYCLEENRGLHDLKQLASANLGASQYGMEMKNEYLPDKGTSYEVIPKDILYEYNAKDVSYTLSLFRLFRSEVAINEGLNDLYEGLLIPASTFLQRVQENGMYVDMKHLNWLDEHMGERIEENIRTIREMVEPFWNPKTYGATTKSGKPPKGNVFNPGSPQQLGYILYKRLRLQPPRGFKKDTRAETIEKLRDLPTTKEKTKHLLDMILDLKKDKKKHSTYVIGIKNLVKEDGRVHPSYLLHGTVTGRLSSREPNAQNIPREADIRDMFVAGPGNMFVEIDYSQAELRVLTHLSGDEWMKNVYRSGRDLHDEAARELFGENFTKEERVKAKMVNFGVVYGRGAKSLMYQFNISEREAQKMLDDWFESKQGVQKYLSQEVWKAMHGQPLTTIFGRQRRFGPAADLVAKSVRNEAQNFAIQSISSDLTLLSAMELESILPKEAKIINIVHDSILIEVFATPELIQQVAILGITTMEKVAHEALTDIDFPFTADGKVGTKWGSLTDLPEELQVMPPEGPKGFAAWLTRVILEEVYCGETALGDEAS